MADIMPQKLEPLTLPLTGARLIEASAGTGKTFTLAVLYLRLLLGLGKDAAFPRSLTVEEILVVTFTEAATEELRGRIRSNIHELRLACVRGQSDTPMMAALMAQIDDLPFAAQTLLAAERQMDEAAIYTIHGFCQRMLTHNAFESGILFDKRWFRMNYRCVVRRVLTFGVVTATRCPWVLRGLFRRNGAGQKLCRSEERR